jgi:hypothetical protein
MIIALFYRIMVRRCAAAYTLICISYVLKWVDEYAQLNPNRRIDNLAVALMKGGQHIMLNVNR